MKAIRNVLRTASIFSDTSSTRPLLPSSTNDTESGQITDNLVTIHLRIEGENGTIFEGSIATCGHDVTLPNGETHHADGKKDRKDKVSYPTPLAALDDAAHLEGFTWDGKYFAKYDGIFITRIADTEQDESRFWGILLNFQYTKLGACHQHLEAGDHLLFAFNAFKMKHFLKLSGPVTTTVGVPLTVTVVDGATDNPMSDVSVGGHKTDTSGRATVVLRSPGIHNLKAERSDDCIRSNVLQVTVSR